MTQDLQRIRSFVTRLVWRERSVLLARSGLQAVLLGFVLLFVGLLAPALRLDRSASVAALVLLAGIGAWVVVVPVLSRWRVSGDVLRQARLVEGMEPNLRGRLLVAVERVDGPQGQESGPMLGLVARRAASTVQQIRIGRVHPARRLVLWAMAAMFAFFVALPAAFFAPGGVGGVLDWWMSGLSARAAMAEMSVDLASEHARVGDLMLRYTYPHYTGLEPRAVPNSTGDVRGPPGTLVEVQARSAEPVEAAALVAYDEPALDAKVEDDGRLLTGSFTIAVDEGTYHLVLYRDGEPLDSRSFSITPEPDLPPEVMVEAPADTLEVALDQTIDMTWRARDDYGIKRVGLAIDGRDLGRDLSVPDPGTAEIGNRLRARPRELGLEAGDRVQLSVVAWDNDTVSGSKPGYSRAITIVVLGARGVDRRSAERQIALRDLMLDILADFLEEPWPPGEQLSTSSGDLASWGESLESRYRPLEDGVRSYWHEMYVDTPEARIVEKVTSAGRELIRYTQVAFTPGARDIPPDAAFTMCAELRDGAVVSLEDGILDLDRHIEMRAMREVADSAANLAKAAQNLKEMLDQDADAQALLSQLDSLERMLARLMEEAARLPRGGLKEFVNQRENEVRSLMDEVRKAIAEGRMDEAKELMSRLAQQLQQMSEGVNDQMESMKSESGETMQQAQALKEELERLENEQRELQSQVRNLREQSDEAGSQKMSELWRKVQDKAAELSRQGDDYKSGLEDAERSFNEKKRAENANAESRNLEGAAAARDLRGSRESLEQTRRAWQTVRRSLQQQLLRQRSVQGPGERELDRIDREIRAIDALLRQLDQQSSQVDPRTQQQVQELEQQQQQLSEQLEAAKQSAQQLARDFPVRPDGMQESLDQAGDRMQQAGGDMQRGQPMQAEGSQGAAADRIKEARESLEQAMQQARQQAQQLQQGGKGGQGEQQGQEQGQEGANGQDGGDSKQPFDTKDFEMPQPEEFRTPEEYRRALLEGMEGQVPEEYRALKKKYYDDLVRQ